MRLASALSRLFLFFAIAAVGVTALNLATAVGDLITSSDFSPGGLIFSTERAGGFDGNLNDLGIPAFAVNLIGGILTGVAAYSMWKVSHGFDKVANRRALGADVGSDFLRSGMAALAVTAFGTVLRALWLLTLPRDAIGGYSLFSAMLEDIDVGWTLIALFLIVMGRIIREAADIAAEHELTV